MADVEVNDRIPAPLDRVWAVVSDFTGMIAALGIPYKSEGEGIGMTRTMEMGGATVKERLEEQDEATHTVSYSILESPFPLAGYQAWIALTAEGDGTGIRWWSRFDAVGDEQAAVDLVRGIYAAGIAGITKVLTG